MIFIGINSKGGAGKSTTMAQILSAFLFERNNQKVKMIEVDDENEDSATFGRSEILESRIIPTHSIHLIDEIFFLDDDILVDVGGNKTATIFLQQIQSIGEYENILWLIPLGSGEQDNLNALETYHTIKQLHREAKILFVLSNARSNDLSWEFLHFFGNPYLETSLAIMKQLNHPDYIAIKSSTIINNSRTFGKTILDISKNEIDFTQKAKAEKDPEQRRKFIFLNRVKNEAIAYIEDLRKEVFPTLDKFTQQGVENARV